MRRLPVRIAGRVAGELNPGASGATKELRRLDRSILLALVRRARGDRGRAARGRSRPRDRSRPHRRRDRHRASAASRPCIQNDRVTLRTRGPRRVSPFFIPMTLANMAAGYRRDPPRPARAEPVPRQRLRDGRPRDRRSLRADRARRRRRDARGRHRGGRGRRSCRGLRRTMRALSTRNDAPERASRPFDCDRDGFVIGEGAACSCSKRAEHARARGARVRAKLLGYGAACRRRAHGGARPTTSGGALRCMRAALADAGLAPRDVDYVNAHATSTPAGDRRRGAARCARCSARTPTRLAGLVDQSR